MTDRIQLAIVGIGRWGVNLLRNFLGHSQVKIVALVDLNADTLQTVKRQYQLDESVLLTTQWQRLKQVKNLEAVVIATPAHTHYSLITDALNWGYHVLAEKPLTLNPQQCWKLCQLAQKQKRQLVVDHTYLFHPAVEQGQAIVRTGKLGDLRYGYACRTHLGPVRQDVDVLWDLAVHDLAIFNSWLGQIPVSVQATGRAWLQTKAKHLPCLPQFDLVWVTLTYCDGFQAYIHLCWLNPDKQRRLTVVGTRGSLVFDEMSPTSPLTLLHGEFEVQGNQFVPTKQKQQILPIATTEPLKRVCDRFVDCVRNNTPCLVSSGWIATQLVQILAAITESLNQGGKPVFLDKDRYLSFGCKSDNLFF